MEHLEHLTHEVTTDYGTNREKKYRNFFVRTYLDKDHIYKLVTLCSKYAFILHDKEDCEPHYHCVFHFDNPRSIISIGKKIQDLTDHLAKTTNTPKQKTHLQICAEPKTAFMYLTHTDASSKSKGKLIYSESEVFSEGISFFKNEDVVDYSTTDILDAINSGVSYRVMAQKYGKTFVCNYGRYKEYATSMYYEENSGIHDAITQLLQGYMNGSNDLLAVLTQCVVQLAYNDVFKPLNNELEQFKRTKEVQNTLSNLSRLFEDKLKDFRIIKRDGECVEDLKNCELSSSITSYIDDCTKIVEPLQENICQAEIDCISLKLANDFIKSKPENTKKIIERVKNRA